VLPALLGRLRQLFDLSARPDIIAAHLAREPLLAPAIARNPGLRVPGAFDGFELAVFHSHLSSPPRPSRTDVENIGLWQGRLYLIYSVAGDELAGWTIQDGSIEPLEVR